MDHYCKNHPNTKTRKRCTECKEYICPECQKDFVQKPFCSTRCLLKAVLKSTIKLVGGNTQEKSISIIEFILKSLKYIGLAVILLLFWISIRNLSKEIYHLRVNQQFQPVSQTEHKPDSDFAVTSQPDAMVVSNKINIYGEAGENIILSLKVNDKLEAVTLPNEQGLFSFENIELKYGSNSIVVLGTDVNGETSILQEITTKYGLPRISYMARDFSRGNINKKLVALTFDGGAGNGATKEILDTLKEENLTCTIFLTGTFIKNFPELTKRIVTDGHEVGNHSWSHPHLTTFAENSKHDTKENITKEKFLEQLEKTSEKFALTTNTPMSKYWRAPFGEHNSEIRTWAAELGYRHIGWTFGKGENLDALDWVADSTSSIYKTQKEVMDKIINFGSETPYAINGGIILMHLDTQRKIEQIHKTIPAIVDSLQNRGYKFVTISEMLQN